MDKGQTGYEIFADRVFPLLLPKYLEDLEILACRLVCTSWRDAVDLTLENHSDRSPYSEVLSPHSELTSMTERHFSYHCISKLATNFDLVLTSEFQGPDNPFIGRHVEIVLGEGENQISDVLEVTPLLEHVGHNIWYIQFTLADGDDKVIQTLLKFLPHLPNLKMLKVEEKSPGSSAMLKGNNGKIVKILQHFEGILETLDLSGLLNIRHSVYLQLVGSLASHDHIKRFGVELVHWERYYGSMFPNLVDLCIKTSCYWLTHSLPRIEIILRELRTSQLKKLRILTFCLNVSDLLKILSTTDHKVESLELVGKKLYEDPEKENEIDHFVIPSLIDLKLVVTPQLNFGSLRHLPNLQYLSVDWDLRSWPSTYFKMVQSRSSFGVSLREFYYEGRVEPDNFLQIWNELPALKVLTVFGTDSVSRQYVREDRRRVFTPLVQRPRYCVGD